MALTSDEINFLIYRYLRESGFEHSAFAFGHESFIYKSSLESSQIAPGALISFVQKGLQYSEIESHIHEDGTESICEEAFSVLKKHQCKPKQVKRKIFSAFDSLDSDYGHLEIDDALLLRLPFSAARGDTIGTTGLRHMAVCVLWHPLVPMEKSNKRGAAANLAIDQQQQNTLITANADGSIRIWEYRDEEEEEEERKEEENEEGSKVPFQPGYVCTRTLEQPPLPSPPPAAADVASAAAAASSSSAPTPSSSSPSSSAAAADAAADSPAAAASSSSDDSAPTHKRQKLNDASAAPVCSPSPLSTTPPSSCHLTSNRSIVSVDWHPRGHTLAAGSFTGAAYLWSLKGQLLHSLLGHTAPVTTLRFNRSGSLLLTASVDHTMCVWDVESGALQQRYHLHSGPVLDVEWAPVFVSTANYKNKEAVAMQSTHPDNQFLFASCGTDGNVWVVDTRFQAGEGQNNTVTAEAANAANAANAASSSSSTALTPANPDTSSSSPSSSSPSSSSPSAPRCLIGHEGEVNSVSWDPSGQLLLTSSDDHSVKIWHASTGDILHDLVDHDKEVLTARWSGTGPCTEYHKYPLFIATGSADTTVKLFDPATGRLLHTLSQHTHPVSQLAFSPRQQLLATASHERVFLWSLTSGTLLRTFKNLGDPLTQTANHIPLGQVGGLNDMQFDNKGEQLAISYSDGMTYVIDLANKSQWEEQARSVQ